YSFYFSIYTKKQPYTLDIFLPIIPYLF
ncbi:hypothetical protein A5884_000967, partial [Enterococcus sp. 7D2_DIV0200]